MRYLYPQRKRFEVLSALFAGGYGLHVWSLATYSNPLQWAGMTQEDALAFALTISAFAMTHAVGVRINGSWRWSPILRLIGMTGHAAMFGFLAVAGAGQTASYVYGWGLGLMIYGASSAARDCLRAAEWTKA
jgi:hypothetical protein